ncbi:hypothetical protein HXX76_011762 [Chlamydomonas incerta]|uniref:5'-Nucleotidase C-terminal domain-containing protein n=1 Tax=Chlamydomonas incerta TaxID=51695 RepID=A0A835VRI0_CHLIN|nr:hypothetical protein HXX76_011762 [Chlamydomonas incerta]|eukprot:KAG2426537.1 hypothetical protein HXX76_011762 [Chlamydomonas incerta]
MVTGYAISTSAVTKASGASDRQRTWLQGQPRAGVAGVHDHAAGAEALLPARRRSLTQDAAGAAATTTIRVLHYNDLYARIEAAQAFGQACTAADEAAGICFGGMARLVSAARTARGGGVPTLTLDAGDVSSGTLWGVVYPGRNITARLQALVGVDAMVLGNQEFEAGLPALAAYLTALNASGIPALGGCNVDAALEPALSGLIRKWAVKSVGGVQVGILGYVTTDTRALTATGGLRFAEAVPAMQACVADFQRELPDVKVLIALGHAGYEVDQQVAAAVPGLALVVGGHTQTFLYGTTGLERGPALVAGDASSGQAPQGPYPTLVTGPSGDQVPVVQAGSLSRYLGKIDVTVDAAGRLLSAAGAPELLGGSGSSHPVDQDAGALAAIAEAQAPVRALETQVIGTLPAALSAAPAVMLTGEAPLGDLICDAMIWYMKNTSASVPDACLINGGAARAPLPAGNVTVADVLTALPFSNTLVVKRLRGLAIISALENGLSAAALAADGTGAVPSTGEFPQVGGLRFRWEPAARPQQRLRSVEVYNASAGAWAALQPCAWYSVVTNDYLASGGDRYASLRAAEPLDSNGAAKSLVAQEYIRAATPALPYSGPEARSARCNDTGGAACPAAAPWAAPAAAAAASCPVSLTLLHYNDVHSRLDPQTASASPCSQAEDAAGGCFGGMARIAAFVKSVRQQQGAGGAGPALVLNAGDMSLGSLYDIAHPDRRTSAAAQNAVGEDAFVLGSHDFDFGLDALVAYLRLLRAPVLVANLNASARPDLAALVRPYTVVELGNTGVRAGIVGWTDPDGQYTSKVPPVLLTPVLPAVAAAVAALQAEYGPLVNIIIGLSHTGLDKDSAVAAAVGGIDAIVGGKDQVFMYGAGNGTRGPALNLAAPDASAQRAALPYPALEGSAVVPGKEVPIVQAFYAGRYVGRLGLNFTSAGDATAWSGNPVLMGGNRSASPIAPDPAVRQLILQFAGELTTAAAEVIGTSDVTLAATRPAIRLVEVPLGNAVCDALRAYLRTYSTATGNLTGAAGAAGLATDVCLLNGGAFRANINQGNITTGGIYAVLPYGNNIAVVNVTGAQLIASLENGISATDWSDPPGRFAQVSGVAFSFDPAAPPGARLLSAALRPRSDSPQQQTPIDPCAHYLVLTNDYMAAGGDGYTDLAAAPQIESLSLSLDTALIDYVRRLQGAPLVVSSPGTGGATRGSQ